MSQGVSAVPGSNGADCGSVVDAKAETHDNEVYIQAFVGSCII